MTISLGIHCSSAPPFPQPHTSHLPTTCCSFYFPLSRRICYPVSRSEICVSCQIPQIFPSPHHSVYVALPPESTRFPSVSSSPFLLALLSSILSFPLSFIDHFHTLSPRVSCQRTILKCQPRPTVPLVRHLPWLPFADRGKISKPNRYILMDLWDFAIYSS